MQCKPRSRGYEDTRGTSEEADIFLLYIIHIH